MPRSVIDESTSLESQFLFESHTPKNPIHPTRTLVAPHGVAVNIDVLMVPLIKELWLMNVPTWFSCQGITYGDMVNFPKLQGASRQGYISGPWRGKTVMLSIVRSALASHDFKDVEYEDLPMVYREHTGFRFTTKSS